MLDALSDSTFALLLLAVIAVCVALSFPLMDSLRRHLEFFKLFRDLERRRW